MNEQKLANENDYYCTLSLLHSNVPGFIAVSSAVFDENIELKSFYKTDSILYIDYRNVDSCY